MTMFACTAVFLMSGVALAAEPARPPVPTVTGGLSGYTLAWSDEFTGDAVDTAKWSYRTDTSLWSAQTRQNVAVTEGRLVINLRKEDAAGKAYTGGGVISKRTFRSGFIEVRLRTPSGAGWHTTFRLAQTPLEESPSAAPSVREVSLFDNDAITGDRSTVVLGVQAGQRFNAGGRTIFTTKLAEEFHTFGAELTDRRVTFYRDGESLQVVELDKLKNKEGTLVSAATGEYRMLLSCVATNLGGTTAVDEAALPGTLAVEYVRCFSKP